MLNKILNISYSIIIFFFVYITILIYFSDNNIKKINDRRNNAENLSKIYLSDLPFIKNDTGDIINYNSDNFLKKKFKKRNFWNLLNINE